MGNPDLSRRLLLASGFSLFALAWTGFLAQSHLSGQATLLDRIEAPLLDLRFLVAGPRPVPPDLIIVALDDETVRDAGRFPLPRTVMADLVQKLTDLGAKAIALDILFIDPGPSAEDLALAETLGAVKAVIAAAGIFPDAQPGVEGTPTGLPELSRVIWPIEAFRELAAVGLVNVTTDHSGTPRHVPLLLRHGDSLVPSFPLRAATRALGAEAVVDEDRIVIGTVETRTDLGLNLPLRFYGPRATIPTISASAVLKGEVGRTAFDGRIVVVGATALGTSDTFATPYDPVFPGVEVLATAIGHLMAADGLVRDLTVRRFDVATAVWLAMSSVLLICLVPLGPALAGTALAAAVWLMVTALAFGHGFWLSAVIPLASLAVPASLCATGRLALDRRQARRLASSEQALRRFQSPLLADRIADDPAFLAHPVQQDAAILFVDLSNFTRLSERLGPQMTRELLRDFHKVVEDEVTRHGGLVLSFMGDGAMIAFGLPDPKVDDASRAVQAAFGLADSVGNWLATRSGVWPENATAALDVRVGAHYGPVVISRLGTDTHQHITATGDSVNVTSRLLEVAAKKGARVVISAQLLQAARDAGDLTHFGALEPIAIRGREQPLTVALWLPQLRSANPDAGNRSRS
jgi:adenylate cyclase